MSTHRPRRLDLSFAPIGPVLWSIVSGSATHKLQAHSARVRWTCISALQWGRRQSQRATAHLHSRATQVSKTHWMAATGGVLASGVLLALFCSVVSSSHVTAQEAQETQDLTAHVNQRVQQAWVSVPLQGLSSTQGVALAAQAIWAQSPSSAESIAFSLPAALNAHSTALDTSPVFVLADSLAPSLDSAHETKDAIDTPDALLRLAQADASADGFASPVAPTPPQASPSTQQGATPVFSDSKLAALSRPLGESTPIEHAAPRAVAFRWLHQGALSSTSREQLARFIARHYQLAVEASRMLTHAAFLAANKERIDPLLPLSVMAVESRFNPFSSSSAGALGLMQALPAAHPEEMARVGDRREGLMDVGANIDAGARILSACLRKNKGDESLALQCYNGASDDKNQRYAARVLAVRAEFRQALRLSNGKRLTLASR